jgi:hypothetical protein
LIFDYFVAIIVDAPTDWLAPRIVGWIIAPCSTRSKRHTAIVTGAADAVVRVLRSTAASVAWAYSMRVRWSLASPCSGHGCPGSRGQSTHRSVAVAR